ncbi:MAG: response regulator [Sedimentisphaerales bacterium]|nr:response regulator [Sedimentisphaerales bacterium]
MIANTAVHATGKSTVNGGVDDARPILLIESDFQYAVAISRAFRELQLLDRLVICVDCENALARLRHANGGRPHLILLDLEMPRMSALGFLKAVKRDEALQMIPVVALADTDDAECVSRCYGLGAAGYMVKHDTYADLLDKVTAVCGYWDLSRLPSLD